MSAQPGIKEREAASKSLTASQVSNEKKGLARIISWSPFSVNVVQESPERAIIDNATGSIGGSPSATTTNKTAPISKPKKRIKRRKECLGQKEVIIGMIVTGVPMTVWENAAKVIRANIKENPNDPASRDQEEAIFISVSDHAIVFEVSYQTTDVISFDLAPDKYAIQYTLEKDVKASTPKIISYSSESVVSIPAFKIRGGSPYGKTSNSPGIITGSILDSLSQIKSDMEEKSPAIRKAKLAMSKAQKIISSGEISINLKSNDPGKNKSKVSPASESVDFGNGLHALKIGKAYKNASKKIEYATAPFEVDYSGWKPNLLGKYFASDSTTRLPTWVRKLGPAGDELIKVAVSVVALKAFRYAIQNSGIEKSLNDAALRASNNTGAPIVNQQSSYNSSISGFQNPIDRFRR